VCPRRGAQAPALSGLSEPQHRLYRVEGRPIPYLSNWLRHHRSLAERVEDGAQVEELLAHPGWAVIEELAAVVADHGAAGLAQIAEQTALSTEPQDRIEFARKRGVQDAVGFHPDVAATIVGSAKNAAAELKREAAEPAAAGR
jgi:hypothetical protein